MKLSTIWRAYQDAEARKHSMLAYSLDFSIAPGSLLARRIRQADRLERAITRRIKAMETAGNGSVQWSDFPAVRDGDK